LSISFEGHRESIMKKGKINKFVEWNSHLGGFKFNIKVFMFNNIHFLIINFGNIYK
jgi:hypothetical protein